MRSKPSRLGSVSPTGREGCPLPPGRFRAPSRPEGDEPAPHPTGYSTTRLSPVERWHDVTPGERRLRALLGADWPSAYLLMLPTVIIMGGLIAYPFLRALYISFTRTLGGAVGPFVGLANYRTLWADHFFRASIGVTARYTIWSVAITMVLSLLAASLIHRLGARGGIVAAMVLLPWVMPEIVRAITWRALLDPLFGGVNRVLLALGIIDRGFPFFGSLTTALPCVIAINVWQRVPFATIVLLAGMKGIDVELYEAAAIDGAGAWRRFLHITLPGLSHAIVVAFLLTTIWSFNEFSLIFLLTGGGPMNATKVYSVLAYQLARQRMGMGVAVAMSLAPVFVALILVLGRHVVIAAPGDPPPRAQRRSGIRTLASDAARPVRRALALLTRGLLLLNDGAERAVTAASNDLTKALGGRTGGLRLVARAVPAILTVGLVAFELGPFYWVFVTAFKSELQITRFESVLWPNPWTVAQFERLLGPRRSFALWLENTMVVSAASAVLSTAAAAAGAYAITRLRWRGAAAFGRAVLVSYLMPAVMIVMPIYHLFARLGLANTHLALIASYPSFALPFALWLLMGYYRNIPIEIDDAALIDGCGRLRAFVAVILPLSRPALAAVLLFAMSQAWGEYLFAYTFIFSERMMTLPLGLGQMIYGDVLPWGELSAATLLMAVPVLLVYALGQRHLVAGLTAGAIRGIG